MRRHLYLALVPSFVRRTAREIDVAETKMSELSGAVREGRVSLSNETHALLHRVLQEVETYPLEAAATARRIRSVSEQPLDG